MSSTRHTIVSVALGTALVLGAGSALLAPTAPARLAAAPAPVESKIATADTLLVLQALWERTDLESARRSLAEELNTALSAKQVEVSSSEEMLRQLGESSRVRWAALPDGDPEKSAIEASYRTNEEFHNQRVQAFEQMRTEAEQKVDTQRSNQLRECFQTLKAAIATIAQREGYSHVISHSNNEEQFITYGFDGVLQGIRDRPVIFAPAGTDLTDALLAELGVTRPTFTTGQTGGPDTVTAPGGAPAGPGAPTPPGQ